MRVVYGFLAFSSFWLLSFRVFTCSEQLSLFFFGLSAMEVGMLSASYLPGRFWTFTVFSLFSVVRHFSTQILSRLYLSMNRVNLSNYFSNFFIVRGRKATYVICHPQMLSAMPYVICQLANLFRHFHHVCALSSQNFICFLSCGLIATSYSYCK